MKRGRLYLAALIAAMVAGPLVSGGLAAEKKKTVLIFSLTKGFRHRGAIEKGNPILKRLAGELGYDCVVTEDPAVFDPDAVKKWDCIIFNNTTQELFTEADRKKALMDHIRGGAGFIGLHAATDSFYKWPEYGEMINGYFDGHPWNQKVNVIVEEPDHPLMKPFGKSWQIKDEIYQFKNYDRKKVRVLMHLDPESVDIKRGKRQDGDYAMCWIRTWGKGRVLYNANGHDANVFQDKAFQEHMKLAMQWACGDLKADAKPRP